MLHLRKKQPFVHLKKYRNVDVKSMEKESEILLYTQGILSVFIKLMSFVD